MLAIVQKELSDRERAGQEGSKQGREAEVKEEEKKKTLLFIPTERTAPSLSLGGERG